MSDKTEFNHVPGFVLKQFIKPNSDFERKTFSSVNYNSATNRSTSESKSKFHQK